MSISAHSDLPSRELCLTPRSMMEAAPAPVSATAATAAAAAAATAAAATPSPPPIQPSDVPARLPPAASPESEPDLRHSKTKPSSTSHPGRGALSKKQVRFQVQVWSHDEKKPPQVMDKTRLDYFTCTLGEAARWNADHPHPFLTVNDLIDEQAKELRQRPAVNFPGGCYGEDGRGMKSEFTFRELRTYSLATAVRLRRRLQIATRGGSTTVGLLCSSTPEFILAWLGLMRLDMAVMLLAPQLERKAIKHLCSTCNISMIFADGRNYDTAKKLKDGILAINISNILYNLKADPSPANIPSASKTGDVAYLFHTSGTSSGLPKPIPQLHHAAVSVLPRLPGGEDHSTFSTTPLYHGGIADCLRAWTSGATIHLFPGTQPITSANIQRFADRANRFLHGACPVKYFTCVPYILQMLSEESTDPDVPSGLALLQSMELVGVGGAALPQIVGDDLVAKGVKLVSRFGSAECGFLLSSSRDYETDHEWSFLRADPSMQPEYYDFEPQTQRENDNSPPLFEFVVKPGWPHRGKTNRPDGSYATADLFEQHPTIPNAWRYHSRADAQITLLNGKKFDPAPVEADLLSSAVGKRILEDAMIFGAGREVPGMLLIPRWNIDFINDSQVINDLWPTVEKMNSETQNHARISKGSLLVIRSKEEDRTLIPKSSKGTILRRQAEALFSEDIERIYTEEQIPEEEASFNEIPDSEVSDQLAKLFGDVLGRTVNPSKDLFAQGVDSLACSRLRKSISRKFFAESYTSLPLNMIYDQGTIERLSKYILRCRASGSTTVGNHEGSVVNDEASEEQLMLDLVHKYRHSVQIPSGSFDHQTERVVVLTGATGLLGAHILDLLLRDPKVTKVYCLVRASSQEDGKARLRKALNSRYLDSLNTDASHRVVCLPCTISGEASFGLSDSDLRQVASEATMIIHAAWSVNFSLSLHSFQDQIAGLRGLLRLRDATRGAAARLVFISSTAAVSSQAGGERPVPEMISSEPEDASPLGYSRSKWVAENICAAARVGGSYTVTPAWSPDATLSADEKFPVVIIRVGQLCGSRMHGAWNASEAYPILLSSSRITGCLPNLQDESLTWLPVDLAAEAVLELSFLGGIDKAGRAGMPQKTPVYHVVNGHQEPSWAEMLEWISSHTSDEAAESQEEGQQSTAFEIVPSAEWVEILEDALEKEEHPSRSLLHLWKEAYTEKYNELGQRVPTNQSPVFETRITERASKVMKTVKPLGKEDVVRLWEWIQGNV